MAGVGLCLLLLTLFWWLTTYSSAPRIFTPREFVLISLLTLAAVALEILLLAGCSRLRPWLGIAVAALAAVANMLSVYLPATDFDLQSPLMRGLLLVAAFALACLFSVSLRDSLWFRRLALCLAGAMCLYAAAQAYRLSGEEEISIVPETHAGEGLTVAPNVRLIDLKHRPNIYVIFFDGMHTEALTREIMGIEGKPAYIEALERNGFRMMRNHYSDGGNTFDSINGFLALDRDHYASFGDSLARFGMATGRTPAPLIQILKANGYRINHLFQGVHAGILSGPYVDSYQLFQLNSQSICGRRPPPWLFFGYCGIAYSLDEEFEIRTRDPRDIAVARGFFDWLLEFFSQTTASDGSPQMFLFYSYAPGHRKLFISDAIEYNAEFMAEYQRQGSVAAGGIDKIMDFVRQRDPGAILLAMGDHGSGMSGRGGVAYSSWQLAKEPDAFRFKFLAKYGVVGAVHDGGLCADYISPQEFTVNTGMMRQLLRCLADGEDPFLAEPEESYQAFLERSASNISESSGQDLDYAFLLYE